MLEALLTIPVLALVLAGALSLNAMYSAKLEAKARARRNAWVQADSGDCRGQSCASSECRGAETDLEAGGLGALSATGTGRFSLRSFVGDMGRFLMGSTTDGHGTATASTPRVLRIGRSEQRGKTTLVCNTRPSSSLGGKPVFEQACAAGLESTEYAREACH